MDLLQETRSVDAAVGSRSVGASDIQINRGHSGFPASDPEEGLHLIRSFLSIRQASLRQAIIAFVTQISALAGDDPRPSA